MIAYFLDGGRSITAWLLIDNWLGRTVTDAFKESYPFFCDKWYCVHLACPHWTSNAHWTGLNPDWTCPHWMHSPHLDPIQNPLPEVVSIRIDLDHVIAHCTWGLKRRGMHAHVNCIDSEHASPGYMLCFTYLLIYHLSIFLSIYSYKVIYLYLYCNYSSCYNIYIYMVAEKKQIGQPKPLSEGVLSFLPPSLSCEINVLRLLCPL